MKFVAAAGAAMIVAFGFIKSADAAPDTPPQPVTMPALPADAKPQPVGFSRMIATIEEGRPWVTFKRVFFECYVPNETPPLTWRSKDNALNPKLYDSLIAKELNAAGFQAAKDPDNLFQPKDEEHDLRIAGNIKDIHATLCMRLGVNKSLIKRDIIEKYDFDGATGYIYFKIDWQLYSSSMKKIVLNKEINTGAVINEHAPGNFPRLIRESIRENIRALIASDEFRSVVLAPAEKPKLTATSREHLMLTGALAAKPAKISDAVGSVVLVMSGGGHGSGFLVSADGYLLTAQHVVGADKYVKIRWSDGLEGLGEVIRTDKRRDVALIKTDSRGRAPLALHRDMPQPGDTVFAIGTPIDPKLQNTVTRGVASANRILDGFSFIQSDVTVDPGNSGGPLLNEQGEVLGLTDIGIRLPDAPTGLNFFIPIRDALDFLSLEPR